MNIAPIEIRHLAQDDPADAALYRDIRLEALGANPEAFGSTFETENAQTLDWFIDRLGASTVLGAFREMKLVAIAGFAIQQGQKRTRAHSGGCTFVQIQGESVLAASLSRRYSILLASASNSSNSPWYETMSKRADCT